MKLYEYQGKELFKRGGVPVPAGKVVCSAAEARAAAESMGAPVMVKAQVLQGGRGKAGFIQRANDVPEAVEIAGRFFKERFKDEFIGKVLLEEVIDAEAELYLSISIDDCYGQTVIVASTEGGMEVESLAGSYGNKIVRHRVDPASGLRQHEALELGIDLGLTGNLLVRFAAVVFALNNVFCAHDAELVEVNPLFLSRDGRLIAGDSKVIINDDALFRQSFIKGNAGDPGGADSKGFNFVDIGGEIGLITIGAGFGMMVSDVIAYYGCRASNFIDTAGGVSEETFKDMAELVCSRAEEDQRVKVILSTCAIAATPLERIVNGLYRAVAQRRPGVPVIASFTASGPSTMNMSLDEAAQRLSGIGVKYYPDLQEAIAAAVNVVKGE